jgi:GTP-binding protein HflX
LACAVDFQVEYSFYVKRDIIDQRYFIGVGNLEKLKEICVLYEIKTLLVNHELPASIQRNIEKFLCVDVMDRTDLILYIFALHAKTYEGKLQVELAQLMRLSTRLIRGWTHLERQKGGIGLRGPGETQLETDRRLIKSRIKIIKQKLEKVKLQRQQAKKARDRSKALNIVLVGYTNAGKSTLFNALTASDVLVQDALFVTLDPTVRKLQLDKIKSAVLIDTVGFISGLPHEIIEAFHATLDAVKEADLLVHVVDIEQVKSQGHYLACKSVNDVLEKLNADKVPVLYVYNKVDVAVDFKCDAAVDVCTASALKGFGLDLIKAKISRLLTQNFITRFFFLPYECAKKRSDYMSAGWVIKERQVADGWWVQISYPRGANL